MSELQTVPVDSTGTGAAIALRLVLLADANAASRARRADQLQGRGLRVALARTPFEAIVKASCLLPDLILMGSSLGSAADETTELLTTCPSTSHIPIVRLSAGRRVPARVFALAGG